MPKREGFPAHAGMVRRRSSAGSPRSGLPRTRGDGPAVLYVPLDNAGPDLLSLRLEAVGTRLAETRDLAPAKRKLARGRRRVPNRSSLTCGRSWTAYSLANGFGLT